MRFQIRQRTRFEISNLFRLVAFTFVLTSLFLIGCGGGDDSDDGGGSQTANDLLDGSYSFYLFADDPGGGWNQLNATTFDGAGGFSLSTVYDSDGGSVSLSGSYTVNTDGTLTFADTDLVGQTSADGAFFVTTDADPSDTDGEILLGVSLKNGSGMSASDLNGTYTVCQIRKDATGTMASRMSFTFDGAGAVSGNILADSDGTTGSLSGTYTVAADGELDFVITGLSKDFIGDVSSDGNIIVILDIDDDGELLLMVGIKTSSGMDAADFSGDYQLNLYNSNGTDTFTSRIALLADGAGTLSADILASSDGDLSDQPDMAYTVGSDGALAITGSDIMGQLSPDGEVFVMVDADATGDGEVVLMIGVK